MSLVVHPWAAMIIAPVGTGKSMLFFDWPVYGLYKYGTRDVLNNACDIGSISMLVEINDEYWLIRRQLKASKTRSISTTSSLARYYGEVSSIYDQYPEILYADRDIIAELDPIGIEEIIFKNETDLQKNLEEFLPARDVFMNRDMMMQESSNIFDLTQTERISVFKHLFWLLDIDSAKDRLWEEKTKLKYLLQAKKDTSALTSKFTQAISTLRQSWWSIHSNSIISMVDYDWSVVDQRLEDSSMMWTTIAIEQVSLIQRDQAGAIRSALEWHKQHYHQAQAQLDQITNQKLEITMQIEQLATRNSQLDTQLQHIDATLATYNTEQLQHLKTEKLTLIQEMNNLEFAIDYDSFDMPVEDLTQAYEYVTKLTQQGKELQLQIAHIDTQIKALQDTEALQIANQKAQITTLDMQIKQLDEQITLKEEKLWIASRFHCIKIEADCPFIMQINDGVITSHARELEQIKHQREQIFSTLNSQLLTPFSTDYPAHLERLNGQKSSLQSQITDLREKLVKVWYKQITDSYPLYQQYQSKLKTVDQQITTYESKLQEIEQITNDKLQITVQMEHIVKEITNHKSQITILETKIQEIMNHNLWSEVNPLGQLATQYQQITSYENQLQSVVDQIARINDLINDYKSSQQEIVTLETRAKRVDELYTIVSKELTVIVLQEYLPVLSDIINNQLRKVVNYQLEFTVNAAGDKLEIMIKDEYGSREVKSLSGWQRAILRLCWILAIALWSGNKFLFLDETINHLDKEMVSKAAELIEEFVQWNKVTLYAITHSDQIQELDIWDHVVRVKEVLE
jgi:DNA repair exonuclease SbcCD ATPase subunit